MDTYDAFDRAVASTATVVKGVPGTMLDASTPCREWTVRDLLNHVVATLWLADALFADAQPEHPLAPGGLPAADLIGPDPAAAYAEAAAAALASARADGALASAHQTPIGKMPGEALAGFTTMDVFVHGWDLARATGQDAAFDPDLTEYVLTVARQAITDDRRAPAIGPEVPAAEHAPAMDRLVAYLGREP